jgi:hypothetical protein
MSNKTNPNDTINAIVETTTDPYGGGRMECMQGGLTKREYFAAIALQGILGHEKLYHSDGFMNPCIDAVKMADELIKALNNED